MGRKLTEKDFWIHIDKTCAKHGYRIELLNSKTVNVGGCECSGCFDSHKKLISIASDREKEEILSITAHEFCHMMQHIQKNEYSVKAETTIPNNDMFNIVDLWLSHYIELNKSQIEEYITTLQGLEHDCELRTIKMIEKYNLPLNIEFISKWANIYILFYTVMKRDRTWLKPCSITEAEELMDVSPSVILDNVECYQDLRRFKHMVPLLRDLCEDVGHKKATSN